MKPKLPTTMLCCLLIAALPSAASAEQKPTSEEAYQLTADWVEELGAEGLVITKDLQQEGFVLQIYPGASGCSLELSNGGCSVTIGFSEVISADTPIEVLNERLTYVAIDRIPTPGLRIRGWRIRPMTPTSSISDPEEIMLTSDEDGRITLIVDTHLFAIYGSDPQVQVPADASAPEDSYFQFEQEIPLALTIEAPFLQQ